MDFSASGSNLIVGYSDGTIYLWDTLSLVKTGSIKMPAPVHHVSWLSLDAKQFCLCTASTVHVVHVGWSLFVASSESIDRSIISLDSVQIASQAWLVALSCDNMV